MAGLWVDEGLVAIHQQQLGAASTGEPSRAALYTNNHTPVNSSVYADFVFDPLSIVNVNPASWTFVLDAANHRSQAEIVLDFDLHLAGGTTYYGIGLYNLAHNKLFYAMLFPAPLVIPGPGINPLPIVLLDYRENCP